MEPKLEPNHHGVLQVLQQEREAETEMEVVDDPLTNPDLVTQVRINTMGIKYYSGYCPAVKNLQLGGAVSRVLVSQNTLQTFQSFQIKSFETSQTSVENT